VGSEERVEIPSKEAGCTGEDSGEEYWVGTEVRKSVDCSYVM
jgi:hypothetical protein